MGYISLTRKRKILKKEKLKPVAVAFGKYFPLASFPPRPNLQSFLPSEATAKAGFAPKTGPHKGSVAISHADWARKFHFPVTCIALSLTSHLSLRCKLLKRLTRVRKSNWQLICNRYRCRVLARCLLSLFPRNPVPRPGGRTIG